MSQGEEPHNEPHKVGDYSIYNNPFNDPELHKKFSWTKKKTQGGDSMDGQAREKREEFQASAAM